MSARYIVDALGQYMKIPKNKRQVVATKDWWFHWDNLHTPAVLTNWMATEKSR
jgi:hypothetical protein